MMPEWIEKAIPKLIYKALCNKGGKIRSLNSALEYFYSIRQSFGIEWLIEFIEKYKVD